MSEFSAPEKEEAIATLRYLECDRDVPAYVTRAIEVTLSELVRLQHENEELLKHIREHAPGTLPNTHKENTP